MRAELHAMQSRPTQDRAGSRRSVLSYLLSRSILFAILALPACDPATTRPDVTPIPEARTLEVRLSRQGAITKLHEALLADSFPIAQVVTRDAWLETPWFDALTLKPTSAQRLGPDVVKLRGWADPARPGNSLIVVELVYRPLADRFHLHPGRHPPEGARRRDRLPRGRPVGWSCRSRPRWNALGARGCFPRSRAPLRSASGSSRRPSSTRSAWRTSFA